MLWGHNITQTKLGTQIFLLAIINRETIYTIHSPSLKISINGRVGII